MNRCIYCYKRLGTADLNNVCSECANKRKETHITTQPIILSRVDFSETYPTVEEVCALIEKDIKGKATYSRGQFYIDNEKVDDILFGVFRAKTLIAIGKFYEELEK